MLAPKLQERHTAAATRAIEDQFLRACGERAERDRHGRRFDRGPRNFFRFTHVDDVHDPRPRFDSVRLGLPDPGGSAVHRRPIGRGADVDLALALAAFEIGGDGAVDLFRVSEPQVSHIAGEIVSALSPPSRGLKRRSSRTLVAVKPR